MQVGDSLHYSGNRPHGWYNDSGEWAKVLWTGTLELFHGPTRAAPIVPSLATGLREGGR